MITDNRMILIILVYRSVSHILQFYIVTFTIAENV